MIDTPEQIIEHSKKLAKEEGLECGYFYYTHKPYHTFSGNRSAIETQIFHAIVKGNKLFNKVLRERITTNIRLNYKETKNTFETHQKKVEKILKKYDGIRNELDKIQSPITLLTKSSTNEINSCEEIWVNKS